MTQAPEEVFKAMNASNILIAILTKLNIVEVPSQMFIEANNSEKQLSVTYNDQTDSFEFKLMNESQGDYELVNN